jgi:tRNA-2-methylthio-N6-dimethylallyladenosine synthase
VAQQEGEQIFAQVPYVDFVLGTKAIPRLPYVMESLDHREHVLEIGEYAWDHKDKNIVRECRFKAFITIMRGCDNFCAYCVVPYTRGREESRPSADIVHEAQHLVNDSVLEITLLGQNVSSYVDPSGTVPSFPELLRAVHNVEGLRRLRFITAHPKDVTPELTKVMASLPNVCRHFHLPSQAGSDHVLRLMNRKYTREWYLSRVRLLREAMPDIAITSDIIVGFPGETDDDFQQTRSLLEEVRYDSIFAFQYSDRPNAKATSLPDHIPNDIKSDRLQQVLELQRHIGLEKHQAMIGRTLEVLPETINPRFPDTLTGRTRGNHIVTLKAPADLLGTLVSARITDAHPYRLSGQIV